MKHLIFISLLLSALIGCKNPSEEKEKTTNSNTVYNCDSKRNYGDTSICLPKIEGINEAYAHPEVKKRVDEFEDTSNIILGYYLDDATYAQASDFSFINYDNYYKVYGATAALDVIMGPSEMKQIVQMMTSGFLDKTLEDVNKSDSFSEKKLQITQPVLIEKYNVTKNAGTIVFLMNVTVGDDERIKAATMSTMLVKKRLIFMAHYLDYIDEETITTLKEHTATFIDAFLNANS